MTSAADWLLAVLLAVWFGYTVLANVPALRSRLRRWDWIGLIPDWALFARPRTHDFALLQRELLPDGTITSWREVVVIVPRPWYSFIWHPALGPKRALLAISNQLCNLAEVRARRAAGETRSLGTPGAMSVMTSVPYLLLLECVSAQADPASDAVQFMLLGMTNQAITGRYDLTAGGEVLFASEFHLVTRPGAGHGHLRPRLAG
jgi:hypothetical protein